MWTKPFAGICALAFIILYAYAASRSPIDSLFLAAHGSRGLPWAWALVAVATTVSVFGYNRVSAGKSLIRTLGFASAITLGLYVLLLVLVFRDVAGVWWAVYVWKDVHVVILLEILWSIANAHFRTGGARRAYGLFCACGSIGGMAGHYVASVVAEQAGAQMALTLTLAPLGILAIATLGLGTLRPDLGPTPPDNERDYVGGIRVLAKSRYLGWLLLLILLVQVSITLIDLHFNQVMEVAYPDEDRRSAAFGTVYLVIDGAALVLQLLAAWILKALGVAATLVGIPLVVSLTVAAAIAAPGVLVVQISRVASKAFDYSIFRAAKEMLYIPLSYDEKTRGKAMIDMLTYRVAKGGAAVLLGVLVSAGFAGEVVMSGVLALSVVWLGVTVVVVRRYRGLVSREEERE